MTPLLTKDLRLAADAMRPWALGVGLLVLAATAIAAVSSDLRPRLLADLSWPELMQLISLAVIFSAVAMGAWVAVVVVRGDETHGARNLAMALPVSPRAGGGLKLGVMLASTLVVAAVASVLSLAQARGAGSGESFYLGALYGVGTLVLGLVGLAHGAVFARLVRGTFAPVAASCGLIVLWFAGAMIAGRLGFGVFGREITELAQSTGEPWRAIVPADRAAFNAAAAGVGSASLALLLTAVAALLTNASRRAVAVGLGVAAVACFVVAALSVPVSIANDPSLDSWTAYSPVVAPAATTK
ncbi:MAG: hypothetical protein JNM94_05295 [Phycisphaerae bacterium]|nr:hypothetical protein [Phycisphaerae bacterium]